MTVKEIFFTLWFVLVLAILAGSIAVAVHFISKYW